MKRRSKKKSSFKMLIILLLLATFLVMSSYAWFTSNRIVTVGSMDVNISASLGFQISVDAVNWKTVIQKSDITSTNLSDAVTGTYKDNLNYVASEMEPFSTATHTEGTKGLMEMFLGKISTDDQSNYVLTSERVPDSRTAKGYTSFDLFFRTNNDMTLALDATAGVKDNATDPSRQGKGIENAARVAFVVQDSTEYSVYGSTPPADVAQALMYDPDDTGDDDRTGDNVKIWEPNYLSHTDLSIIDMYNVFGSSRIPTTDKTHTFWTSAQTFDGIYAVIPEANPTATPSPIPATLLTKNTEADNGSYFKEIPDSRFVRTNTLANGQIEGGAKSLDISLPKGVTKVRVYMWLEGQDWDCGDTASGADIQWNLVLTRAEAPLVWTELNRLLADIASKNSPFNGTFDPGDWDNFMIVVDGINTAKTTYTSQTQITTAITAIEDAALTHLSLTL